MSVESADRLTDAYMDRAGKLRRLVIDHVLAVWDSFPALHADQVGEFVDAVLPLLQAGILQMDDLTAWYVDAQARELSFGLAANRTRNQARISTRLEEIGGRLLERPASTLYGELAAGKTVSEARQLARQRLQNIAVTELSDAARKTAHSRMRGIGYRVAYRRVLTGRENCALCAIASTRAYWTNELMPIHPGCDCGVALVPEGASLDRPLDGDLLEQVHDLVERDIGQVDRAGKLIKIDGEDASYRDLIVTYEHSELGPALAYRKHHHKMS